ncbi:hypothetical protein N0V90_000888 [Kalmusia sp. IMI 367209]|nr:hypothetical protein N0V90_000888 [Kalmusia sp. IMI 367209]
MRLRELATIISRERETYEYMTTQMDPHANHPHSHNPHISLQFLVLFFDILPQELRDMIYAYVIPSHTLFIIQPPLLFTLDDRNMFEKITPYSLLPYPDRRLSSPYLERLLHDLTTQFFSTNTFWTRYRYTAALHTFLTTPFAGSTCFAAQHVRNLNILLAPPESAEDSGGLDSEEAEYEWEALFPVVKNGKCKMWKAQLKGDLRAFEEILVGVQRVGEGKACKLDVILMDLSDSEKGKEGNVEEWLSMWIADLNKRGGKVRLLQS